MKIHLHEITDFETELDFTEDETWIRTAVESADETQDLKRKERPIGVHFSLRKVDDVVVLSGRVKTDLSLICSRCANPFQFKINPDFSGLLCKDPVMAGVGYLTDNKPAGQNKGYARHAHDSEADKQSALGKDLDITYLSDDYVDLSEVLTEHLRLQTPFQPLCREDCKGMCLQCGADLNIGRCACAKIAKSNPFSVLKDFRRV